MPTKQPREDRLEAPDETVQLDLEGYGIEDTDSFWICKILESSFGKGIDVSGLADYLIENNDIGTVLKKPVEDDEAEYESEDQVVFALTSIVDLSAKTAEKYPCVSELRNFLNMIISKSQNGDAFKNYLWSTPGVVPFLLINERFSNLPAKLNVNALASLMSEINDVYGSSQTKPTVFILCGQYYLKQGIKTYVYPETEELIKYAIHYAEYLSVDTRSDEEKAEEDFGDCYKFIFAFQSVKLPEFLKALNFV